MCMDPRVHMCIGVRARTSIKQMPNGGRFKVGEEEEKNHWIWLANDECIKSNIWLLVSLEWHEARLNGMRERERVRSLKERTR